jgi:hypothetical protein
MKERETEEKGRKRRGEEKRRKKGEEEKRKMGKDNEGCCFAGSFAQVSASRPALCGLLPRSLRLVSWRA